MSDRLTGLLIAVFAVWYGYTAQFYTQDFSDPLGPSAFPQVLSIPLGLLGLYLLVRPDPDPDWVRGRPLLKQVATIAILIGYSLLIEPLGFILATTICSALLAPLLGARWMQSAIAGVASGFGFFFLFNNILELPLPAGALFGG